MEPNKLEIMPFNPDNSYSWLASCGYIFPSTKVELLRFNSLYGEKDPNISGEQIDPHRIIKKVDEQKINVTSLKSSSKKYKLVATIRLKPLPTHIIEKLRKKGI
jgi:hypothetical protein